MPSYNTILATALALASANAHILMRNPAPYTLNGKLNNSPLDPSGSDFPCKMTAGEYTPPLTKNVIPIGTPQTLGLNGSATHGGGSCQIALTKDLKPTKQTVWQVIHSEEGGCPSNAPGNLDNKESYELDAFKYEIPKDIAPGDYTFAWTWFNKIGNREMYMNCAPITVTGGSKKRELEDGSHFNTTEELASDEIFKRDAAYPDLFRANIGNGCATEEGPNNLAFPNPGPVLVKAPGAPVGPPVGTCGKAAASSGSGSPAAPPAAGSQGASGTAPTPASAPSPPAAPSIVAIPPPGAAAATGSVAPSGNASSGSSSGGAAAPAPAAPAAPAAPSGDSCSTPGQSVCSPDGTKIGTCDTNMKVIFMPVAAGTKCEGGIMVHAVAGHKRSARFAKKYYGRH
ncbi:MAG: hypothetical protein Q9200_005316 [Gallowayella weberi]